MGVEDLAAACRKERHLDRFGVTLVLVKGIEVALDNVAENVSHGRRGYLTGDVPPFGAGGLDTGGVDSTRMAASRPRVRAVSPSKRCERAFWPL